MEIKDLKEFLVENKLINKKIANQLAGYEPNDILDNLIKSGYLNEDRFLEILAKEYNLDPMNLLDVILPDNLIKKIPRYLTAKYLFIPIHYSNEILTIAICSPIGLMVVEELQILLNCRVKLVVAKYSQVSKLLKDFFKDEEAKSLGRAIYNNPNINKILAHLLVERGIITEEELINKAREFTSQ
ncbi:MAG: hypothetical protein HY606_02720 [Planctomycetes bacterium]|nr:hypothetical protein [Planctomycetota bacterium]